MLCCCWSPKGGSGTTVVAGSLGLELAAFGWSVLLVDLAGDLPALLGVESGSEGLGDWLTTPEELPADSLRRLERPVTSEVSVLPLGARRPPRPERIELLSDLLAASDRAVVVDAGTVGEEPDPLVSTLVDRADVAVLVVRSCYLALRRCVAAKLRADEVVLVEEVGRALTPRDVEEVIGVPVRVRVPVDPAVARAVDAGLLPSRRPRSLRRLAALVP